MRNTTVERETKYNQFIDDSIPYECMLMFYKEGRYPWKCDFCNRYQHPDHEMTQSIYYRYTTNDGPNFCGYHCMMKYRDQNDVYRFFEENQNETKIAKQKRKTWNIKTSKSDVLDYAKTDKQRENILNALHAVVNEEETEQTSETDVV